MCVAAPPRGIKIEHAVEVGNAVVVKHKLRRQALGRNPGNACRRRVEGMHGDTEPADHFQGPADAVPHAEGIDDAIGPEMVWPQRPTTHRDQFRRSAIDDSGPSKAKLAHLLFYE